MLLDASGVACNNPRTFVTYQGRVPWAWQGEGLLLLQPKSAKGSSSLPASGKLMLDRSPHRYHSPVEVTQVVGSSNESGPTSLGTTVA